MSLRILMVEDVASDARLIEHVLRREGLDFEVERVATEHDFLESLSRETPDVILSDFRLAGFDGLTALLHARERVPQVPFILVTGALSEETAVACMRAGASDYVLKDRLTRLGAAIQAALDRKAAEESLRSNQEMFRLITENVSDRIEVLDREGRRLYVTPRFLGRDSDPGDSFRDAHPADRPRIEEAFRHAVETGRRQTEEFRILDGDDYRYVEAQWNAVRDRDLVVVVTRDITQRREAERFRVELERAERIIADLQVANEVQRNLVWFPPPPRAVRVFAHLEAARVLGGDFYDVSTFGGEERYLICTVGDVVGKGVSAALSMVLSLAVIRDALRGTRSPAGILERANLRLREHAGEEEPRYVSAVVASMDLQARKVRFARAGHEEPLVWRARDARVERVVSRGTFLGVFADAHFEEIELDIAPGDKLVLFTDGITETRGPTDELFGAARLHRLVEQHGALPVDALGALILSEIGAWRGDGFVMDDIALLIVELMDGK